MKGLRILGRILFGIPFLFFGINHLINGSNMTGTVPAFIPGDIIWVYLTGIGFILFAISIFTKKYTGLAGILLGVTLLIFALTIHLPNVINQGMASSVLAGFLKDIALAGAAFFVAGYYIHKSGNKFKLT